MGYYDDDYEEPYDGYEERIEPVNLVAEGCTESDITDALLFLKKGLSLYVTWKSWSMSTGILTKCIHQRRFDLQKVLIKFMCIRISL